MDRLGLPSATSPDSASTCLEEIRKLWAELEHADGFRARIRGIDRDQERFDLRIGELLERLGSSTDAEPARGRWRTCTFG